MLSKTMIAIFMLSFSGCALLIPDKDKRVAVEKDVGQAAINVIEDLEGVPKTEQKEIEPKK